MLINLFFLCINFCLNLVNDDKSICPIDSVFTNDPLSLFSKDPTRIYLYNNEKTALPISYINEIYDTSIEGIGTAYIIFDDSDFLVKKTYLFENIHFCFPNTTSQQIDINFNVLTLIHIIFSYPEHVSSFSLKGNDIFIDGDSLQYFDYVSSKNTQILIQNSSYVNNNRTTTIMPPDINMGSSISVRLMKIDVDVTFTGSQVLLQQKYVIDLRQTTQLTLDISSVKNGVIDVKEDINQNLINMIPISIYSSRIELTEFQGDRLLTVPIVHYNMIDSIIDLKGSFFYGSFSFLGSEGNSTIKLYTDIIYVIYLTTTSNIFIDTSNVIYSNNKKSSKTLNEFMQKSNSKYHDAFTFKTDMNQKQLLFDSFMDTLYSNEQNKKSHNENYFTDNDLTSENKDKFVVFYIRKIVTSGSIYINDDVHFYVNTFQTIRSSNTSLTFKGYWYISNCTILNNMVHFVNLSCVDLTLVTSFLNLPGITLENESIVKTFSFKYFTDSFMPYLENLTGNKLVLLRGKRKEITEIIPPLTPIGFSASYSSPCDTNDEIYITQVNNPLLIHPTICIYNESDSLLCKLYAYQHTSSNLSELLDFIIPTTTQIELIITTDITEPFDLSIFQDKHLTLKADNYTVLINATNCNKSTIYLDGGTFRFIDKEHLNIKRFSVTENTNIENGTSIKSYYVYLRNRVLKNITSIESDIIGVNFYQEDQNLIINTTLDELIFTSNTENDSILVTSIPISSGSKFFFDISRTKSIQFVYTERKTRQTDSGTEKDIFSVLPITVMSTYSNKTSDSLIRIDDSFSQFKNQIFFNFTIGGKANITTNSGVIPARIRPFNLDAQIIIKSETNSDIYLTCLQCKYPIIIEDSFFSTIFIYVVELFSESLVCPNSFTKPLIINTVLPRDSGVYLVAYSIITDSIELTRTSVLHIYSVTVGSSSLFLSNTSQLVVYGYQEVISPPKTIYLLQPSTNPQKVLQIMSDSLLEEWNKSLTILPAEGDYIIQHYIKENDIYAQIEADQSKSSFPIKYTVLIICCVFALIVIIIIVVFIIRKMKCKKDLMYSQTGTLTNTLLSENETF